MLPAASGAPLAVLGFAAHHVVLTDLEPAWVLGRLEPHDLGAPMSAAFLAALATRSGLVSGVLDVVLAATGRQAPGLDPGLLRQLAAGAAGPPRLAEAYRHRSGVRAWATADGAGTLVLGRGVAGRTEMSLEVAPHARGRGLGRTLAAAALALAPPGEPVFAQVAAANVASLRALLAAGYTPVGAEVLFRPA